MSKVAELVDSMDEEKRQAGALLQEAFDGARKTRAHFDSPTWKDKVARAYQDHIQEEIRLKREHDGR